jgi:hypothetical protein
VDDCELCRAVELLEYVNREIEATKKAQDAVKAGREPDWASYAEEAKEKSERHELTKDDAEGQFAALQAMMGQAATRIPEPMREMIRWAEEMKAKRKHAA